MRRGTLFPEELETLLRELREHGAHPGDVPARPLETGDQSQLDRIADGGQDDRDRAGGLLRGLGGRGGRDDDQVDPQADELGRQVRVSRIAALRPSVLEVDVLAVDPAEVAEAFDEESRRARGLGRDAQVADPVVPFCS